MENRLCLNKRPTYELPNEVIIGEYARRKKNPSIPNFEPDICITNRGSIKIKEKYETFSQIWVKTDNKEFIEFIKTFDFESRLNKITNAYIMNINDFKKILLEEFYEVKHGE